MSKRTRGHTATPPVPKTAAVEMGSLQNGHHRKFVEPHVSFIVPVYKVPPDVLKRCLVSLDSQDYENLDVVVVFDGGDPDLEAVAAEVIAQAVSGSRFKTVVIPHGGACAARNAGLAASVGEIVSFFNSDYIAKPGMCRRWVEALTANPDCGFVYGAYEYAAAQRWLYYSKPFDPYLLDVANYIDCGFPLWRKYAVPWDTACKSLQDWDFWLRVVKTHGVRGHYMGPEPTFIAAVPRAGGLSEDSSKNWIDRVHYVKKKNGIGEPELVVTSLGAQNHGIEIAKMLGADFRDDTIHKPNEYKALYLIGLYTNGPDTMRQHGQVLASFQKEKTKRIVHFVGADIYHLRNLPWKDVQYLAGLFKLEVAATFCETDLAREELAAFGFDAQVVPIPPYSTLVPQLLPRDFRVAIFLTEKSDFDKYCLQETLSIVRAMPDVEFTAYGDYEMSAIYSNLKIEGAIPRDKWPDFVARHSCLLRLCRHDTLPMATCEFIMAGRDVVTNIPSPYTVTIPTKGTIEISAWDHFGEGLNAYNWPRTKKLVVQALRDVRAGRAGNGLTFTVEGIGAPAVRRDFRAEAHEHYAHLLDRETYFERVYGAAGLRRPL